MGVQILLVEDDDRIRSSLRLVLEDEGHAVDDVDTAEAALAHVHRRAPDLVIVDLMLPGKDGFDLCRDLRRDEAVPILILSARGDSHDVVAGLEAGADDYMVKPPVPKELAARVRALLRRTSRIKAAPPTQIFGALELSPEAGVVRVDGQDVALTKTEFRLLCELADAAGRILTREALLERVWGYGYFGDGRIVDVHIRRLRAKVEAPSGDPPHIVTVRGLGYKLEP